MRLHGTTTDGCSGYQDELPCPFGGAAGSCYVCDLAADSGVIATLRFATFIWMEAQVDHGRDSDRLMAVKRALELGLFKLAWP